MVKQYLVKFWTTSGQLTSMVVGAVNGACAIDIVQSMPNFNMLAGYPEEL